MKREQETASSRFYSGSGGKFRKPAARKPPTTPYTRPTTVRVPSQSHSLVTLPNNGGWISKLVGGATRMFPSFFSKPTHSDPNLCEFKHGASSDAGKPAENLEITASIGVEGLREASDRSIYDSDVDHEEDKIGNLSGGDRFCEIEQMLKRRMFSREEINRLTEILHSKADDVSNIPHENQNLGISMGAKIEGIEMAQVNQNMSVRENQEDSHRARWGVSSPQPTPHQDMAGVSPIHIARAYMGTRASEPNFSSKSIIVKNDKALACADEFASKPFFPSPLHKSSVCWPGAVVEEQHGYVTPQSRRGSFGLHNHPRTPYSRNIFSNSRTNAKLPQAQGTSEYTSVPSTPFQQLRTPTDGLEPSRSVSLHNSVGPIHRTLNNSVSDTRRGPGFHHSTLNGPLSTTKSNNFEGMSPAGVVRDSQLSTKAGTSKFQSVNNIPHSSEVGISTVHPQSCQLARTILEHIDRTIPTPKQISAELNLASKFKKPAASEIPTFMSKKNINMPQVRTLDPSTKVGLFDPKTSSHWEQIKGDSISKVQYDRISESSDAASMNVTAVDVVETTFSASIADPSLDVSRTFLSQRDGTSESYSYRQIASKPVSGNDVHDSFSMQSEPPQPHHSSRTKRGLSSICISKPDIKGGVSSDKNFGFTFPITTSLGALTELPTPSILPYGLNHSEIPSYSFDTKRSTSPRLVFSRPSSSSVCTHDDASDIKFQFGSDKKSGVSFCSAGGNGTLFT